MKQKCTIAIIDDDADLRQSLCWMMTDAGYQVRQYDGGQAFLDDDQPDAAGCVIADIRMPGMSGFDLLRQMRKGGWNMPVILTSACRDDATSAEAFRQGASFLPKPARRRDLLAMIEGAIRPAISAG